MHQNPSEETMRRSITLVPLIALVLAFGLLAQGCTAYKAAVDERSVGGMVDDEWITAQIEAKFLDDKTVKYLDFDSASYQGHVFITGEYESKAQVDRAVAIARGVEGVRRVTTVVFPKREGDTCGTLDNMDIYRQIKQKHIGDEDIHSTNVDIEVVQCHIIMMGIVGSQKEIDDAVAHAKTIPEARSVRNYLRVR